VTVVAAKGKVLRRRVAIATALQRRPISTRIPWTLVIFVIMATVPWVGSRYDTFLASQITIDALFAVSLNLLLGTTGLVSFGHVAYFGVGAYVCGILMKTYEVPFSLAFPAAGLGAALFALISGYFCVRLIKLYFAMLTLAFSQIVWAIAYKWNSVTGGDQGLPEIPYPNLDWMSAIPGFGDLSVGAPLLSLDASDRGGFAGGRASRRTLTVRSSSDDNPRQSRACSLSRHQRPALSARRFCRRWRAGRAGWGTLRNLQPRRIR
jgi:hypothetical protein